MTLLHTGENSYDQILAARPHLTYLDCFEAAQEALSKLKRSDPKPVYRVSDIRGRYPRAYEEWTSSEDQRLHKMILNNLTVAKISSRLLRRRSAIRSRIIGLNLVSKLSRKEQARLIRISKLDPREIEWAEERKRDANQRRF